MDIQTILIIIIILLSINLVLLIVYVILILKEARQTIYKVNRVLDTISSAAEAVSNPIASITAIIAGFSQGFKLINLFKSGDDNTPNSKSDKK
ncbi:hypothetical protein L6255_01425 [Candidatus Parcubacteria bacterium]|nr:hypothetical protein [Patescibacteria group bacterium]MBU4381017.1 hypothetical protein [Patescibacteria group bacterium]MCG2689080.1 hypothetical protein [Candidatus Parcubacteria bacterium]